MEKKKTIIYNDKEFILTTPIGECFQCEHEESCRDFHCCGSN
jgi:hypothetical protein